MPRRLALALVLALLSHATHARALNRQGARAATASDTVPPYNLSGYLFAGVFVWNPTYAARPNNTGLALLRYGLHVDADLYRRYLTLSYDGNVFTDGAPDTSVSPVLPSELDHIVGILSTFSLPHHFSATLALHYELDSAITAPNARYRAAHPDCAAAPRLMPPACYDAGYTQSYADVYARLTYERGPLLVYGALGGFVYNPSYAARPDNAGIALLRYVVHGELRAFQWLSVALDFNMFTDRDTAPLKPSELDAMFGLIGRWRTFSLTLLEEADMPLGTYPANAPHPPTPVPGLSQYYVALLLQWNFDLYAAFGPHAPAPPVETEPAPTSPLPAGSLPAVH